MRCTATIEVGGATVECIYDGPHEDHTHGRQVGEVARPGHLSWTDGVPGATPHKDPTPTYRVKQNGAGFNAGWDVGETQGQLAATFWPVHPDPEGAAKAEAARLNGEDEPCEGRLHERVVELIGERDRAIHRAAVIRSTLREVLDRFTVHGHPGRPCLRTHWQSVEQVEQWRSVEDPDR